MKYILFILFSVQLVVMADNEFRDKQVPLVTTSEKLIQHDSEIIISQVELKDSNQSINANPDIPPKAKKEREDVYQECLNDQTLSAHFECKCWSDRFLEERMLVGPKVSAYNIKSGISDQCFNIPGAAEYALKKCEGYGKASYDLGYNSEQGMSFEEYCQCVSNNYAIQIDSLEGRFTRPVSNKFMTSSYMRCKIPRPGDKNVWKRLDQ